MDRIQNNVPSNTSLYDLISSDISGNDLLLIALLVMLIITMRRFPGQYLERRKHQAMHTIKILIDKSNDSKLTVFTKRVDALSMGLPFHRENYFTAIVQGLKDGKAAHIPDD
ncbi:MAG: hypothetical protein MRK01_06160 [Candidatus Scalindua sp.]|nr:hypothetical protein [Candidatus Scalindua sp.]